ncbi:hypothetical protein Cpin_2756 [Chitinophaga pinensis DSM 2588]|uniref:Uncharacterized protein n=1 Tax=Chitinophaga pinensis (strain ATCC 43595 / DSM 2588 / LMG 13176 / NBRC 15968 / NCIMB 11800 / UQM 2034) TaxID=485918 RepID=A0A979G3N2_CHIPD|nr:hypothetical protein Cpin_2756 [Chitinophaga pinensis DSM 2588]
MTAVKSSQNVIGIKLLKLINQLDYLNIIVWPVRQVFTWDNFASLMNYEMHNSYPSIRSLFRYSKEIVFWPVPDPLGCLGNPGEANVYIGITGTMYLF